MSNTFQRIGVILLTIVLLGSTQVLANQDRITELEQLAQETRELELLSPLELTVLTREQFREQQAASFDEEIHAADLADQNMLLVFLGFLEPGQDYLSEYSDLMGENVLGFYDFEQNTMVLVSENEDEWSVLDDAVFVHETTHAIQDQHFDLMSYLPDVDSDITDDAYWAFLALSEGDAQLTETLYLVNNNLIDAYIAELSSMSNDALSTAPFFLSESTMFPYETGTNFIMSLWMTGGWDLVNEAWANPPTTTEQILHPEKYLAGEGAMPVAIVDPIPTMGPDWRSLEYNEFGEFGIQLFLRNGDLSKSDADTAAAGWGGDAMYLVTNEHEVAMAWSTVWDSEADAEEFYQALVTVESNRLGAEPQIDSDSAVLLISDGWHGEIRLDGDQVVYLLAESAEGFALISESQEDAVVTPAAVVPDPVHIAASNRLAA